MMKKQIVAATLFSALILLSACNTVEGAGKDVSSAGDTVSNAARDSK
ncbi:MAG TPA: entericidin A/B family lipoprotein [Sphingobium sp.]